jgi:aryl-alcohol dehydrogenase-like predicted oxidoreductase
MSNEVVLVTGASHGLGLEVVRQLARRGATVILTARNTDKGEAAARQLAEEGLTATYPGAEAFVLSTKYTLMTRRGDPNAAGNHRKNMVDERNLRIAQAVSAIADEVGRSPAQVALNWVRQQSGVVIPIVGSRKLAQIQDNLACVEFTLTDEQMRQLDEVSKIELGFPHDFLASDEIKAIVFAGTFDQIDRRKG